MSLLDLGLERPGRWDKPFDLNMTDEHVRRIMAVAPFSRIDAQKFPKSMPLAGILKNDTRLVSYKRGDLIVREGDYGSSAFFIMSGSVRVAVDAEAGKLADKALGRTAPKEKTWKEAVSQLWTNSKVPEYRASVKFVGDSVVGGSAGLRTVAGNTRVFLQDVSAVLNEYKTVQLHDGEFFGEIAALGRTPRTATIFADDDGVELLEIKWQGLRDIRNHAPEIRDHIDRIYRERSLNIHLRETPMFSHLTNEQLEAVAAETQFKSFGNFDWHATYKTVIARTAANRLDDEPIIVEQGDYPNAVILIRAGFARLSEIIGNGHRTVSYFGRGQFYGYREVFHNWKNGVSEPYQFTLRGIGHTDVLIVPSQIIEKLVLPTLPKEQQPWYAIEVKQASDSEQLAKRDQQNRVGTNVLEFLVENRYINGTAAMMINLDRCTRCDDCIRACANAHDNNPKFIRDGKQVGNLMIGHACMQCQDPVCMIGCPTGAIHRETLRGNVVINDLTCIGCGSCAASCPYENIQMVETRNAQSELLLDKATNRPIVKATKCDLCLEQIGGPACQNACPHDALVRVDVSDRIDLVEWLKR